MNIKEDLTDEEFLNREDLHARIRNRLMPENGGMPNERVHATNPHDCGCKKDYPFSDILPKDETYIDFTKNKERIGMVVADIGLKCTGVMTFVHTLKNHYPEESLASTMDGLQDAVDSLEEALNGLKIYLESQEMAARDVLKSGGTWVKRSL